MLSKKEMGKNNAETTVGVIDNGLAISAWRVVLPKCLKLSGPSKTGAEGKERVKSAQVFQCDETRVGCLPRTGQVQNRKPQGSDK